MTPLTALKALLLATLPALALNWGDQCGKYMYAPSPSSPSATYVADRHDRQPSTGTATAPRAAPRSEGTRTPASAPAFRTTSAAAQSGGACTPPRAPSAWYTTNAQAGGTASSVPAIGRGVARRKTASCGTGTRRPCSMGSVLAERITSSAGSSLRRRDGCVLWLSLNVSRWP